ncbi:MULTISPECIES: hypothetical protein [Tsukamurella]|uniref:Uncharacterized protein n=1 Tax=Tsukamurella asaccharolytica TaxID=2592067 RepID=A0A5C5R4P2_9ACTN|nr:MULTISPECIES: hypothetical protein [Tsukamurella]KXP04256.1 hypothetical protein AXK59_12440 [Tsukamurella tyrosinosolvens]TWS17758.1 hypothetical protein FK529_18870 [Tsukamurella asaccharolytica]
MPKHARTTSRSPQFAKYLTCVDAIASPVVRRPDPEQLLRARKTLGEFMTATVQAAATELGFGYIGTPDAPSTYQQLRAAYDRSASTGEPLPISDEYCDGTIYLTPEENIKFRFWHDTSHIARGLSFRLEDEWELALWHLEQLRLAGLGPGTLEYELFRIDVLGQVIVQALIQRFPYDQRLFSLHSLDVGMDAGILAEVRRRP